MKVASVPFMFAHRVPPLVSTPVHTSDTSQRHAIIAHKRPPVAETNSLLADVCIHFPSRPPAEVFERARTQPTCTQSLSEDAPRHQHERRQPPNTLLPAPSSGASGSPAPRARMHPCPRTSKSACLKRGWLESAMAPSAAGESHRG